MPCNLAGSAIAQGRFVGRIDQWSIWKPTEHKVLWLLLSGASNPPRNISVSERRTRDNTERKGSFLNAVILDLANMEKAVRNNLHNCIRDIRLTKEEAKTKIVTFFAECKDRNLKPMMYYTGHGEIGTGNWCFEDGTMNIEEILDILPEGTLYPIIFSDACYSGHWANFCLNKGVEGLHCLAACPEFSTAIDTTGKGGDLTLFMTGKKLRPQTEPIYSKKNRLQCPITERYDSVTYLTLIASLVLNSDNILISQSINDGYFYGVFAPIERYFPRPSIMWKRQKGSKDFLAFATKQRERDGNKRYIYSLACDDRFGFGAFFMSNYGTEQEIVTETSSIKDKFREGFSITACAAQDSAFFVVMTKGTEEYRGRKHQYFLKKDWNDAATRIGTQEKRSIITGVCYSRTKCIYFVVMTESPKRQIFERFDEGSPITPWLNEKHKQGYHPTIIFKDPADGKVLLVVTEDEGRTTYTSGIHYMIK